MVNDASCCYPNRLTMPTAAQNGHGDVTMVKRGWPRVLWTTFMFALIGPPIGALGLLVWNALSKPEQWVLLPLLPFYSLVAYALAIEAAGAGIAVALISPLFPRANRIAFYAMVASIGALIGSVRVTVQNFGHLDDKAVQVLSLAAMGSVTTLACTLILSRWPLGRGQVAVASK